MFEKPFMASFESLQGSYNRGFSGFVPAEFHDFLHKKKSFSKSGDDSEDFPETSSNRMYTQKTCLDKVSGNSSFTEVLHQDPNFMEFSFINNS